MFNEHKTTLLHCPKSTIGIYNVPATIKTIGIEAFYYCCNIVSVTLPEQLHTIELKAFEGCRNLQYISLPQSLIKIGFRAFSHCTALHTIQVEHTEPLYLSPNLEHFHGSKISACTLIVPSGARKAYLKSPIWQNFANIIEITQANDILTKYTTKQAAEHTIA